MTRPVFLLSLPRAGSTLLQRLLLASGRCATLGEPSLLLRFLGEDEVMTRRAPYWDSLVGSAMTDMRQAWPGFDDRYREGVRELMGGIYDGLADGKEWFLDKTPRYTLIAEEIYRCFPDAKFIVLWRHPLAVAASLSSTYRKGRWCPDEFGVDLCEGMERLHRFCEDHPGDVCQVRYEDLVSDPAGELKKLGEYLGWDGLEAIADEELPSTAGGSMGDATGVKKYARVSSDSREAWKSKLNNWYRRRWVRNYYADSRSEWLNGMGYGPPDEVFEASFWQGGIGPGVMDMFNAGRRARRHLRRPRWLPRFARRYRKDHGYEVSFR